MDLVAALPAGAKAVDSNIPRSDEGLELLWSGVSEALTDQIDAALQQANISHEITNKEFGLLPNLAQGANFVWIDSRDRATSRSILGKTLIEFGGLERDAELGGPDSGGINPFGLGRKAYSRENLSREAPFETDSLFESNRLAEPVPDDIVEDFDPEDATSEVWSGEDDEMAQYLKLSLAGIGIGCVLRDDHAKTHVFVLPASESRASKLIREVIEGTPSV